MAVKGYVPTTVPKGVYGSNTISNGVVSTTENLRDKGYPDSRGTVTPTNTGSFGSWYLSQGGKTKQNTTPTNTGGTKTGGSTSGSGSSAGAGGNNAADAYNALLAAYRGNDYSNYLAEMRAAAQAAYDRGMNALNSAYDSQLSSLSDNLNQTKSQLLNQYNRSKQNISDDAAASLRQAYINKMMSEKNIGQQMSALGLNGGATETTLANMLNNYGNARNNINTTRNKNLSELEGNYSDNLSQAMQAYNSAVASANLQRAQQAMSLENALANNQISALGDYQTLMQRENSNYLDLLKAAIANGASFSYDPTQATNAYTAMNVQQAANPTLDTNYQAAQALMNGSVGGGVSSPGITVLNQTGTTTNPYLDILNQLYGQRARG